MSEIDIGETIKNNIDYWKNLYFEEKEKNKELEEHYKHEQEYINGEVFSAKQMHIIDEDYISKDKIRKKLEHQNMLWNTPNRQKEYNQEFAEFLEELLLEKN